MKRLFLTFILSLCLPLGLLAQTFTDSVHNSHDKKAIPFANVVALKKADKSFLAGALTNEQGIFSLEVKTKEDFIIQIKFIGYKTKTLEPKAKVQLGQIFLEPANANLDEVVISGKRKLIIQKADRLVFDVTKSPTAGVGNSLDVLSQTPGLIVDQKSVSIIGKSSLRVMINDRPVQLSGESLINYLKTISATNIESVEVITTPPARYDAEGNSGLINIILKKSFSDMWSNTTRFTFRQASYQNYSLGNTFNFNKDKLALTFSIDGTKGYDKMIAELEVNYPQMIREGVNEGKMNNDRYSSHLALDYELTPKASVGLFYSFSYNDNGESNIDKLNILSLDKKKLSVHNSNGANKGSARTHSLNLHYIQKLSDKGHELSTDFDYFYYGSNNNRYFASTVKGIDDKVLATFANRNIGLQNVNNFSAKFDIDHPCLGGMMNYGAKHSTSITKNETELWNIVMGQSIRDKNQSLNYDFTESISAMYWDFTRPINQQWSFKLGLRGEYTRTKSFSLEQKVDASHSYYNLFPTVFLNYTLNQNHNLNLNYNRRIGRPSYWSLNPFRMYLNSTTYLEGTPNLRPQITDNLELQHVYKGFLISKVFGGLIHNMYGQMPLLDIQNNMQVMKWVNFADAKMVGLSETLIFPLAQWWSTVNSFSIYYQAGAFYPDLKLNMEDYSGVNASFYTQHQFFFNKARTFTGELTYYITSPQKAVIVETGIMQSLNLGLRATFLGGKLQCYMTANDIFKTSAPKMITKTMGYEQKYYSFYDNRHIKIGFTYNFGSSKVQERKHQAGNNEELNRVGN